MPNDKVFIFGASMGGQNYLTQSKENIEVLGFIDNDVKKQGTEILGYKVFSPNVLKDYGEKFDYIVVTSMYIESILQQLKELYVPQDKVKFPPKNMLKIDKRPFEVPEMRNKATDLLCDISNILKEQSCYVSFGTLLGIIREDQLLSWDDDIDFSIFSDEVDIILKKLIDNIELLSNDFDLKIYKRMLSKSKVFDISIHCYWQDEYYFQISFACLNNSLDDEDMYVQEVNITPKKFFKGFDEIIFNNVKMKAPKNYIGYLEYTYGDWKVPKKNTTFYDNSLSFKETEAIAQTLAIYDFTKKN
ncbi:LicD family protein [Lysinibacillus sp. NPDC093210]|uniref:LicD family protein n=1 Tax=Lysinibacillus sp. NPDC093210 TaxID=3364133 RepID=UPI0038138196